MKQLTDDSTWYAVVYVTVRDNPAEPDENRYLSHTKVIALSQNREMICEFANALNEQRDYPYRGVAATDVSEHMPDFAGKSLFVTDRYTLSRATIRQYEDEGRVLGHHKFNLRF
ncbi:hypothetical protein IK146_00400 [Candidatus Saccharibacteria bacterium]|nr:hypothetical protein [Candidatus Saccharibacteria bacterium]